MSPDQPFIQQYLKQNPYQAPQPQVKKKQSGRGGTLTSLISEGGALGGAAAGAAVGSVVPVVGTAIGGLIGAGLGAFGGRLAENKVRDNRLGVGDAAKEGILTGVLGGVGKGVKYSAAAGKALGNGAKLEQALIQGADAAATKGKGLSVANKVRTTAADKSAKGFGVKTDKKLLPDQADEVTNFIFNKSQKYGGITAGAPMNQARAAQTVKNNVVKQLDTSLDSINRPLKPTETRKIIASLDNRLINDPDVTGNTELANKFKTLIINKDIKGLEKLRRSYDDIAFKANGDPSTTAKAAEAAAIRDTIDEFVTPLSKEYKSIKGDYGLAKKALELTAAQGGKETKGIGLPFINGGVTSNGIGGDTVTTVRNKFNAKLAGNTVTPTLAGGLGTASGARIGSGIRAGIQGQVGESALSPTPAAPDMSQDTSLDTSYGYDQPSNQVDQNPYPQENLLADIQRDPAHQDDYIKLYQQYQDLFSPKGSELTSGQQTRAAAAQNALNDFPLIEDAISTGKLGGLKNIPGSGTSLGRRLLGTEDLDAALFNIADNILRARSGAAAPEAEVLRFKNTFLPGPLDSETAKRTKLQRAMRELQGYVNPAGAASGSSTDLIDALRTSGYN